MSRFTLVLICAVATLLIQPVTAHGQGIELTISEPNLGQWTMTGTGNAGVVVAPGQLLAFSWSAAPESGGATIVGYRYGWDLLDPFDPDDPGWVGSGLSDVLAAPPISFSSGVHALTVRVEDDLGASTVGMITITVGGSVAGAGRSVGQLKGDRSGH